MTALLVVDVDVVDFPVAALLVTAVALVDVLVDVSETLSGSCPTPMGRSPPPDGSVLAGNGARFLNMRFAWRRWAGTMLPLASAVGAMAIRSVRAKKSVKKSDLLLENMVLSRGKERKGAQSFIGFAVYFMRCPWW